MVFHQEGYEATRRRGGKGELDASSLVIADTDHASLDAQWCSFGARWGLEEEV